MTKRKNCASRFDEVLNNYPDWVEGQKVGKNSHGCHTSCPDWVHDRGLEDEEWVHDRWGDCDD